MNLKRLVCIALLLFSGTLLGQTTQENVPLEELLEQLENKYQVQFNYRQELLGDLTVSGFNNNFSLDDALEFFRNNTDLVFTLLSDKIISVTPINNSSSLMLCGYLKDKDTLEPLIFANIFADGKGTTTNSEGYFEIDVQNKNSIIALAYLGYKTINRPYKFFKTSCEAIYLVRTAEALPEIILQQYLVTGIDKLNNGALQFNFDRFSILPGLIEADVLQAIQNLPGIQSVNETVSNISIRGSAHDQNLILWDDIKMYQSGHFFGLISVFNPQMNQEVTLTKNGTISQYSDGIAGTIAMKTASNITSKLKVNAGVNLVYGDVFVDLPIGTKASLQVAGRKSISDILKTPTYVNYYDRISQNTELTLSQDTIITSNQNFDFYDVSMRYNHRISDKDQLRVNFLAINNELVFSESASLNDSLVSRESSVAQRSIAGGIYYGRQWHNNLKTELQIYNTDYTLKAINANILLDQRFLQENSVSETGIKLSTKYTLNNNFGFTGGYQFIETKVTNLDDVDNPIFRSLSGQVLRIHNGFLSLSYNSRNKTTVARFGGRINYFEKFDRVLLEPRLSVFHAITSDLSVELLGEYKNQATSQIINFQNDFLGVEKRRWQLADNTNIPLLESKQASFGVNFNPSSWLFNVDTYYKEIDGITAQSQGFLNQFEFSQAVGTNIIKGLDVLVRKDFGPSQLWASYSYMLNQYNFESLYPEPFLSNYDLTHTVSAGVNFVWKNLKLAIGSNWHTGAPYTQAQEVVFGPNPSIGYQEPNAERLPDYLRFDVSGVYKFNVKESSLQLAVSVWNVLDQRNVVQRYFIIDSENQLQELEQRALGLTPNASLRYYF